MGSGEIRVREMGAPRHVLGPVDSDGYPPPRKEGRCKATWKREFKLPWREAGPPNHHDDKVDSDQWVVDKELSLVLEMGAPRHVLGPVDSDGYFFFFITLKPRVE